LFYLAHKLSLSCISILTNPTHSLHFEIEARVRLAAIAYMRHYEASTAAAPAQPHQQQQQQQLQQQQQEEDQATLSQALANLQAAQALEERYSVRVRRWDIPFMIGKLLVKAGRARHGRHLSYAEIEEAEPGWLDSFLSQFQRAQELAEGSNSCSKMAKKDALYRLHASRLRALLSDHRKVNGVGVVAAPSARMLQVLRRYNTTGREGGERGEEILAEAYLPQLRWKVMMDAMGALATCRRLDSFDHRSIYQRARASEHLLLFVPGSMATRTGGEEATAAEPAAIAEWESERGLSKDTVKALAARTAGERAALSAIAARELMHLLFEKKRTQIVAVWLAEECSNVYELINQVGMEGGCAGFRRGCSTRHPQALSSNSFLSSFCMATDACPSLLTFSPPLFYLTPNSTAQPQVRSHPPSLHHLLPLPAPTHSRL